MYFESTSLSPDKFSQCCSRVFCLLICHFLGISQEVTFLNYLEKFAWKCSFFPRESTQLVLLKVYFTLLQCGCKSQLSWTLMIFKVVEYTLQCILLQHVLQMSADYQMWVCAWCVTCWCSCSGYVRPEGSIVYR